PRPTPLRDAVLRSLMIPAEWLGRIKARRHSGRPAKTAPRKSKPVAARKKGASALAKRGRGLVRLSGRLARAVGLESFIKGHVLPHLIMAALGEKGAGGELLIALEREVGQELDRIASGRGPIVVGPWTSEVGFELLYWIPFVHWFARSRGIAPSRLF